MKCTHYRSSLLLLALVFFFTGGRYLRARQLKPKNSRVLDPDSDGPVGRSEASD